MLEFHALVQTVSEPHAHLLGKWHSNDIPVKQVPTKAGNTTSNIQDSSGAPSPLYGWHNLKMKFINSKLQGDKEKQQVVTKLMYLSIKWLNPQHKKLYLATQAWPLCSTPTSKDSNGIEQTEQRARQWIDQRKYTRETPQFAWCMQLICLSKYLTKFLRGVKLSQHREKWFGNVYLFNKLNVSSHAIFELSSTSRKNKIITRPCNPVLIFLILHQLWVRDVVVPNLDLQLNEKYNQIVSHLMA